MSKLQEKLEKVNKALSNVTGFGFLASYTKDPTMLTLAALGDADGALMAESVGKGADVVIISPSDNSFGRLPKATETISVPWGIDTEKLGLNSLSEVSKSDADFLGIRSASPAVVLSDENRGRVLYLAKGAVEDSTLRTLAALRLDAVAVELLEPLDVTGVAFIIRVAMLSGKPVLAIVGTHEISLQELEVLRDAGVKGLIVPVMSKNDVERLAKLRKQVDALPAKTKRFERGSVSALVPSVRVAQPRRERPDEPDEDQ